MRPALTSAVKFCVSGQEQTFGGMDVARLMGSASFTISLPDCMSGINLEPADYHKLTAHLLEMLYRKQRDRDARKATT